MPKKHATTTATPGAALRNAFAPEALLFERRAVDLGSQWGRVYTVASFPPSVDAGWLATVANLEGVTLSVHALPIDPTQITLAMSRAISLLAGQLAQGGSAISQQRMEQQIQDAQALLRKIDQEQQSVFTVGVFALVTAPDEAAGLRRCKRLEGMLAAAGMRARPLAFRQEDGLKSIGPWGLFPKELHGTAPFQLPAETLAASFPFSSGGINHGHGIVLGHDTSGGLVLMDRWDPPADAGLTNKNWTILAASGAGKSHTTMLAMIREWLQGATVIAIDPLHDYYRLCRALGGNWINAGAGGSSLINPLQAPPAPVDGGEDLKDDQGRAESQPIWAHLQQVHLFFDLYLPDLSSELRALLGRALRQVYRAKGFAPETDPSTVSPEGWPHVGDVHAYCHEQSLQPGADPAWRTLAALLEEAAEGTEAALWAGPSSVSVTDADFVVLDVHELDKAPDRVQQAQYINVLNFAWAFAQRRSTERVVLVVDEAWILANPKVPQALAFLKRMAKSIRHYNGSLLVVTQNPGDFLFPEVAREGEPVLSNASVKLLLRQEARDLPTVTQLYGLSEVEQEKLRGARRGEGLLIAGNHRAWVRIDTAPHETALMYG